MTVGSSTASRVPLATRSLSSGVDPSHGDRAAQPAGDEPRVIPPIAAQARAPIATRYVSPMADEPRLSHLDSSGRARMVDVGDKRESDRRARAQRSRSHEPGDRRDR